MNPSERPPEKSNYSYEEMMRSLRKERKGGSSGGSSSSGGGGGGSVSSRSGSHSSQPVRIEVIENEDGTQQVAEVRKRRKRRTHQPKKAKEERLRKIKRLAALIGVPLVAGVIGIYFLMLSKIKSVGFREAASERISELAGAPLEFGDFKMRGLVLDSRKVVVGDVPDTFIRGGEVISLKGNVNTSTFLSSDWKLGVVQATDSVFRFGVPPERSAGALGAVPSEDLASGPPMLSAGFGLDRDPARVDVEGLRLGDSDLVWEDGNSSLLFVSDSSIDTGRPGSKGLSLILTGGKLTVPGWPEFGIRRISGEVKSGTYTVKQSSLEHVGEGMARLTGNIDVVRDGAYDFAVEYDSIRVREIVHPYWVDKFGGEIDGQVTIRGSLASPGSLVAEGTFEARKLVLSNNDILKKLSLGLGESQLARIQFRSFRGSYRRTADKVEFYDLEGEHRTLLRIRGKVSIDLRDDTIAGEFMVGIPESILSKVNGGPSTVNGEPPIGGKPPFFGDEDADEFSWTKVILLGLIDEPREDLTEKLEELRVDVINERRKSLPLVPRTLKEGSGTGADAAGDAFEKLIGE